MSENLNNGPCTEMPRYRCHKEVWALKIKRVYRTDPDKTATPNELLSFEDEGYAPLAVTYEWARKHRPQAGGYYVVYKDGYASYSPAEAFEDGYTKLP